MDIHPAKLRRRLKERVFPSPTFMNEYGLKFFDEEWLKRAEAILANSFEGEIAKGNLRSKGEKELK